MPWPIEVRLGGSRPLPPPPDAPSRPSTPDPSNRPSTIVGFLSDLSKNPKQAFTFVLTIGSIIGIATLCFAGACFAVTEAAKGIKGVPLQYILPVGISGASILTLAATLLTGWIRRLLKVPRADAESGHSQEDI